MTTDTPKAEPKSTAARRGAGLRKHYRIPEERYAAARIIYETVPGMSYVKLADETGISWRSLEERARKEGWTKRELLPDKNLGEAAQAVADKYSGKLAEYGPEITADNKLSALQDTASELATDLRGQLIERHRREWGAIRSLVYETLKNKDYGDKAKLAKITAETLQIMQSNERRAWGIDKPGDGDAKMTVVIERGT